MTALFGETSSGFPADHAADHPGGVDEEPAATAHELGATAVEQVIVERIFANAVSGGSDVIPNSGTDFRHGAKCGGISIVITDEEATLLARHGATTDVPALNDIRLRAPLP
ncbi:MAG: hypothetical protein ABI867_38920 [Kofleriaceae bacterium]